MPPELFATYRNAKELVAERRYDEALGKFYAALELDPLNLHIRLEVGALQEQLQLFLDALETYDDAIALATRADERTVHVWRNRFAAVREFLSVDNGRARRRAAERARHPIGEGWQGRRARAGVRPAPWWVRGGAHHSPLLIARYRYAMVLGFSEVVIAQWIQDVEDSFATRRDLERDRLRMRLLPRLSRYDYRPCHNHDLASTSDAAGAADSSLAARTLNDVRPYFTASPAEGERLLPIERELRSAVRRARKIAAREPRCIDSHPEFTARIRRAEEFELDQRPATALMLHGAAKSLKAAAQSCPDKSWSEILEIADRVLPEVGPPRQARPTGLQVLRAQEVLQQAAVAEVKHLVGDYRWWRGRRRPEQLVTQRALRVSLVAAELRRQRVERFIHNEVGGEANGHHPWPPSIADVSRAVTKSLGRNPFSVHDWQDFYNAACAYAIPLLPSNSWAGQRTGHRLAAIRDGDGDERTEAGINHRDAQDFAAHTVRALERAIDTSDSHFAAGQRNWLAYEDPDFIGFRGRAEYAQFRARNLIAASSAVPIPKNVHVLQLSAYVSDLLKELASAMIAANASACGSGEPPASDVHRALELDRQSWRYVGELAREHRDWRSRLAVVQHLERIGASSGRHGPATTYPTYPDPRIGDLADVSNQHDARYLTIAGRYARQERAEQLTRLGALAGGPISRHLPSEAQLSAMSGTARVELLRTRARAWILLRDCLGINFFTDDKTELVRRKELAAALEKNVAATLQVAVASRLSVAVPHPGPTIRRRTKGAVRNGSSPMSAATTLGSGSTQIG